MAVEPKKPDFSGYWRLVKTENFEKFLKDVGLPWALRKAALRFGVSMVDIVRRSGPGAFVVTSLCAKGSWTRTVDTGRPLKQQNVLGETCTLTSAWEGSVLVTTIEGSVLGTFTSARFMAGPTMVVRSAIRLAGGTRNAVMYWYFDRMQNVEDRVCGVGVGPAELQRQLSSDQCHVQRATKRGNAYLRSVLLDWDRWRSPADDFIPVPVPSFARSSAGMRSSVKAGLAGPPLQQALTLKLVEFCENRGISAVVPLGQPGSEPGDPQLLGMSPEQAEETAAKLHELETDMLLGRQASRGGWSCCGLVVSRASSQLPDHLRVWEMSLGA